MSHRLFYDERRRRWRAGLQLATAGRLEPSLAYDAGGIGNVRPVGDPATLDEVLQWLAGQVAPGQVAEAILSGRSRWTSPVPPGPVVAALTFAGAGVADRACEVLLALQGLDTQGAEGAERAAQVLGISLTAEASAPASAADVLAAMTRLLSGDTSIAQTQRWSRRWVRRGEITDDAIRHGVAAIGALRSPADTDAGVAAWRLALEHERSSVRQNLTRPAPSVLPGVGTVAGWPVRQRDAPRIADRGFELHAAFCRRGSPPEGRERVEMFFDCGAFPVWTFTGGMCGPDMLGLSADLTADLWSLARHVDRPGTQNPQSAVQTRITARFSVLRDRLETETGLAATFINHWGRGDSSCPTPNCQGSAS